MFDLISRGENEREIRPSDRIRKLYQEMDAFISRFKEFGIASAEGFFPAVDVSETEKEMIVRAELPGMTCEELDLSVSSNVLTIRGEKKAEHMENQEDVRMNECFFGRFSRSVTLPSQIDQDAVEAEYKQGVLTVKLLKSGASEQGVSQITVQ
ncbi:Hsp20/alpha crystallin family protein [Desulfomonile tiedjei]|uniref:Molecular chaperone (Small heat shock protein) n=1 Tax=Desulfomonile tiedjei (strain ATCC 49306 / DSM 6799 / DCB-1) TaxID=706587 RepID=I4C2J3_DESTA|nr:Hsp20/alpha crystallin family protein [Desulfomonile tiedjei]AFM23784.1 molecular chaperone (small heat shock protein) [Desulfomonile tiedjei DSM 6799]